MDKRESKELIRWVRSEIKKSQAQYTSDGKFDPRHILMTILQLSDTPSSYDTDEDVLIVNEAKDAMIFRAIDPIDGGTAFEAYSDAQEIVKSIDGGAVTKNYTLVGGLATDVDEIEHLNSLGGEVTISGSGKVSVTEQGQTILISGELPIASEVDVLKINGATLDDVQDWLNSVQSAGIVIGGALTVNTTVSGTIDVEAGVGFIKIEDSPTGETRFFDWDTITEMELADNNVSYIFISYGDPITISGTTDRATIELNREFTLGRVYRSGDDVHAMSDGGLHLPNFVRMSHERLIGVRGFERASGGVISEDGARYLDSTAGIFYLGNNKITTTGENTNNGDRFTAWYHTGGVWKDATGQQQVSNTQYDNGTDLANLTGQHYGVFWVYIHYDSDLHVVYGRGDYTLAQAENATVIDCPDAVCEFGILAAKIIIQRTDANFLSIVTAYETLFPVSNPADHNDLGNIQGGGADDYHHLIQADYTPLSIGELKLTPKAAAVGGAEGTMFYNSGDDHVYVGTE